MHTSVLVMYQKKHSEILNLLVECYYSVLHTVGITRKGNPYDTLFTAGGTKHKSKQQLKAIYCFSLCFAH
jgi:hypothetical protein